MIKFSRKNKFQIVFFVIIFSCINTTFSQYVLRKTFLEDHRLNGNVKNVAIYRTAFPGGQNGKGISSVSQVYLIDKNGMLSEDISFLGGGSRRFYNRTVYEYDFVQRKIDSITYKSVTTDKSFIPTDDQEDFEQLIKNIEEVQTYPYQKSIYVVAEDDNPLMVENYLIDGKSENRTRLANFKYIKTPENRYKNIIIYDSLNKSKSELNYVYQSKNNFYIVRSENGEPKIKTKYSLDDKKRITKLETYELIINESNQIIEKNFKIIFFSKK